MSYKLKIIIDTAATYFHTDIADHTRLECAI
jgi:hypothetical protein